jgi:uncharacterized protein YjbI with pentapeptide repeats/beta-lactamase regulating signal transducer with metallopeptidase domain
MLEAIVGVALYAVVASIVLGAILAGCVLVATRTLALTAATRHLLWTIALVATGLMPFLAIGTSLLHATSATSMTAESHLVTPSTGSVTDVHPTAPEPQRVAAPTNHVALAPHAALGEVLAGVREGVAANTPMLSRNVALGLIAVWLVGAAIGLGSLLGSLLRVRGLRRRSSPLDSPLADELPWLTEVGPGREIYLRLSYEIETPVAIGFRRPVILIPTELATSDGLAAIEQLVLHEYAHLRRYDDWTNLFQRTIERLLWFNPIVWLVGRRIALEREIASDDAVVERTGAPHRYATSLWKLAREMRMPEHAVVAPGALLTRKQISVRIERLLDQNRARLHRSPAAALAITLAGCAAVALVATAAPAVELPSAPAIAAATATAAAPPTAVRVAKAATHVAHALAVRQAQPAAHAATARLAEAPAHLSVLPATPAFPVTPVLPATPALPAHLPSVAPVVVHVAPVVVRVPASLSSPRASASSDSVGAWATQLAEDVQTSIRDNLPRRIADDDDSEDAHLHLDGKRLTRELIGACVGCSMRGADLHGLDLHGLTLNGDDLRGADLHGANLTGAKLTGVSLRNANLSEANLTGAVLSGVELSGATFDGAQLDGVRLIGVELRDVSLRGTALRSVVGNCVGCDLHGLDLHGQDLHGIMLSGADLRGANLSGANLHGVRFSGVDLSHANLAGADLTFARLDGCNMNGANLNGAQTGGLRLSGTDLGG